MQLLINGLIAGSLAALLAGGLALVFGVLRVYNLALGQTVLFGGYVAWRLQAAGLPLPVAFLGALAAGAVLSWITFDVFVKPFYKYHPRLPLVTTIALGMILDGVILLIFEERPRGITLTAERVFTIGSGRITAQQIMLILASVVILSIFAWMLHATPLGRRIRAVVDHEHAAMSLGIPAVGLSRLVLILSGLLATAGGIFIGIDQSLTPTLAFPLTIRAYAAVIAGGMGNFWGAVLLAYVIALAEQFIVGIHWFNSFYVPASFQASVPLLFIILFLLLRPTGLGHVRRTV